MASIARIVVPSQVHRMGGKTQAGMFLCNDCPGKVFVPHGNCLWSARRVPCINGCSRIHLMAVEQERHVCPSTDAQPRPRLLSNGVVPLHIASVRQWASDAPAFLRAGPWRRRRRSSRSTKLLHRRCRERTALTANPRRRKPLFRLSSATAARAFFSCRQRDRGRTSAPDHRQARQPRKRAHDRQVKPLQRSSAASLPRINPSIIRAMSTPITTS